MISLKNFSGVVYRSLKELARLRYKERSWITIEDKGAGVELYSDVKNPCTMLLLLFAFVKKTGLARVETAPLKGISR